MKMSACGRYAKAICLHSRPQSILMPWIDDVLAVLEAW